MYNGSTRIGVERFIFPNININFASLDTSISILLEELLSSRFRYLVAWQRLSGRLHFLAESGGGGGGGMYWTYFPESTSPDEKKGMST